ARPGATLPEPRQLLEEHASLPVIGYSVTHDVASMPDWISPNLATQRAVVSLSRFNEYRFVRQHPVNQQLQTDYQLNLFFSGSLAENQLDLFMTLLRARSTEIVWSNRYTFPPPVDGGDLESIGQVEVIVSGLLSPYGIIYGDLVGQENPPPRLSCVQSIYRYFSSENLQDYSTALSCAQEAIETGNAPSSIHALLAFLKVEAYRRELPGVSDDPLVDAREHATLAVTLDEANARAYQAMFAIEKVEGNTEEAIALANRAMDLNPFDRDVIGDFAAYLISIGRLEEARESLARATRLTPTAPAWLQFFQFLHADLTGDHAEADRIVMATTRKDSPLIAIAKILAHERNENPDLLPPAINILLNNPSGFLKNPEQAFLRRGFSPELAKTLAGRIDRVLESDLYREMTTRTN
ncbi:MAG: tetratricopeptide repeat protein, partial [Pseudomonadota bacterium]